MTSGPCCITPKPYISSKVTDSTALRILTPKCQSQKSPEYEPIQLSQSPTPENVIAKLKI